MTKIDNPKEKINTFDFLIVFTVTTRSWEQFKAATIDYHKICE